MEVAIHLGCEIEHKKIKDVKWPENCLIVSITRGGKEIIPSGDTTLLGGDYLTIMADEENS
ncbi:TrkA C-terminal domain-containing protein, partial [Lawsonibacter sp. DFI.5.51]|nr:TrkA C-terminal domain-containing protein [Lawsonibacter sp. DFI.5.51]